LQGVIEKIMLFTVDVESHSPGSDEDGALWIAEMLSGCNISGTFFIAGEVVEKRLDVVKEILKNGHEVASHGSGHRGYYRGYERPYLDELSEKEALEELERSYKCFQNAGIKIRGYRAPRFRIRRDQLKLVSQFFDYDSSFRKMNHELKKISNSHNIAEFPVSHFCRIPIPIGSPYLLAGGLSLWKTLEKVTGVPSIVVFYCHSFDVVSGAASLHPKIKRLKRLTYYRHCGETGKLFLKSLVNHLLEANWNFLTCAELLEMERVPQGI